MDWILLGYAVLIVAGSLSAFIGFVWITDRYPGFGAVVLLTGLFIAFVLLVYSLLGGDV